MARSKYDFTESKRQKWLKEGRGSGRLSNYKPWITALDFPSKGRVHRLKGWTTNRIHHFVSDAEKSVFLIYDWASIVSDIREQFPILPLETTLQIASDLGISHPRDPNTGVDITVTSDFLLNLKNTEGKETLAVRTVKKNFEALDKDRDIEKLQIEKYFWESKGVDWGIITEQDLNLTVVRNIDWVHAFKDPSKIPTVGNEDSVETVNLGRYFLHANCNRSIAECGKQFDAYYQKEPGTGLSCIKHLIANKEIPLNLHVDWSDIECSIEALLDSSYQSPVLLSVGA